jgi:hypothetical protein
LDLTIAAWFVQVERRIAHDKRRPLLAYGGIMILLLLCLIANLQDVYYSFLPGSYKKYLFLSKYTKQYDVILSDDLHNSAVIPTFGGKIVATNHLVYGVNDQERRREDVKNFFDDNTTYSQRLGIIKKYRIKFILLNQNTNTPLQARIDSFRQFGDIIYSDSNFILIKVKPF